MIQANCRTRFTAEDFDFVVKTLGKSPANAVSLVKLLTDSDLRDAILDHELLFHTLLTEPVQLSISPQFYFYILTRHVLKETGINDRPLTDYLASLLEEFSRTARLKTPTQNGESPSIEYISDMMLALRGASPAQTFFIRAHMGNYSLFLSGIFHENVQHRTQRGAPDFSFYEDIGRMNYRVVAHHSVAKSCELTGIYETLASDFREVRVALNRLSERLLNLDENHAGTNLLL